MKFDSKLFLDQWNGYKAEYALAQSSRLQRARTGVSSVGRKADYHYRNWPMFARILEVARDIDRNDMVVGQGISRLVNNVIQGGISLDSRTGNRDLDKELVARWNAATIDESFSSTGELTFNQMEKLVCRAVIVDGDVLAIPLDDETWQLTEAHRLRTPSGTTRNVVHGIWFDGDRGRPKEYWITKEDISPFSSLENVNDMTRIPARDADGVKQVLHVFNPKRISQHRGVSSLVPIGLATGLHDDIQMAKLVQQQSASMFAVLRSREKGVKYGTPKKKGETQVEEAPDGTARTIEGIAMGLEFTGMPGETITGFSPNIPNPEFFQHAMMVLSIIAINLDLPLIVFLLDASQTNFSGWRGAMDQAKIGFRAIQKFLTTKFHRPIYLWCLRNWLATDASLRSRVEAAALDARSSGKLFDIASHSWNGATWPYVQPVEDVTAYILRRHGLDSSPRRLAGENGLDWGNDIIAESLEDNELAIMGAIETARRINGSLMPDEDSFKVHWRDCLSLPMPDRINLSFAGQASGDVITPAAPAPDGSGSPNGNGKKPVKAELEFSRS